MASLGHMMRRLASRRRLDEILTEADSIAQLATEAPVLREAPVPTEAPKVILPRVDTKLNMHQHNGFFDDGTTAADGLRNSHVSPEQPANATTSPDSNPAETPSEWSAVGHAATGKSGRVIHNLQEDIARLTREMSVWRSRAEETQRSNEALKIQLQNTTERLHNLEQVNETNLISLARKDRKIEELRSELNAERTKRQDAESTATKTNQTMREERATHHRKQARTEEIAKYHATQYEVVVSSTRREKAELEKRIDDAFAQVRRFADAHASQRVVSDRLEVICDQKNRAIEVMAAANEKLRAAHAEYKQHKDNELHGSIERSHANNAAIEKALAEIKDAQTEMKWVVRLAISKEEEAKQGQDKS